MTKPSLQKPSMKRHNRAVCFQYNQKKYHSCEILGEEVDAHRNLHWNLKHLDPGVWVYLSLAKGTNSKVQAWSCSEKKSRIYVEFKNVWCSAKIKTNPRYTPFCCVTALVLRYIKVYFSLKLIRESQSVEQTPSLSDQEFGICLHM